MDSLPAYTALLHAYVAMLECLHALEKQSVTHLLAGLILIALALASFAEHR